MEENNKANIYDSSSIKVLEGLEAVRKRPGMYIGSTGEEGLHHMIWEIVDNSIDEAMGGFASFVKLTLEDNFVTRVEDDGRGIPVDIHPKTNRSTVETVFTVLHAGGKFDNDSYKVSGGLHGVGASVVNALSSSFKVWVFRQNKKYFLSFSDGGKVIGDLVQEGNSEKEHGTIVEFVPDFSVMEKSDYKQTVIVSRLQQLAFLNKGIRIDFVDNRKQNPQSFSWKYDGGLVEYIHHLNNEKEPLFNEVIADEKTETVKAVNRDENYTVKVEVAFQYNKTYNQSIFSFCNNINTTEGGTHVEGFRNALVKIINRFAVENKFLKDSDEKINRDDVCEGLTAIISIKHPNPQYEGQTKKKLGNTEVRPLVNSVVSEIFERFMLENPQEANAIIRKTLLAQEARRRSQEARELTRRKSPFDSGSLPGKLADCTTRDPSISELYIVEGDSAGGTAKTGRDRYFQAILPLRGKILNVEKSNFEQIFNNAEISALVMAIGCGIKPDFELEKLRYSKIVIMTDADVDGAHIRTLLLTFFFRFMYPLVEQGNIFIAQPPLYKVSYSHKDLYMHTDVQLEQWKSQNPNVKFGLQRYKGLGEMDALQLWETTMDPKVRTLLKVTVEDASIADKAFSLLMGDEVPPRREFIEKNARSVKNIDI
ncbi:DNA topoisomerase (ATP-hydrolyzing) subunit B [Mycoplasmoides genitalium]|uniref:DNA gyrase subunit B n=2 Tax=Mycoplasmoides genitalium TaxID=2097 RepID=GYRB_MYCGE|nr:DNA topoisomerase (ATP-hydrolyzing) subunit B [Mycoplasmoides genitalium]P47249.1 RecName: Full=DNA gyrase subunit B [Mycoplasmoides genitalium G37]ABY79345.1 DNA gyrase, B subunit [synthetic Mycoplasma genitalium JCVI-1.0]AAA57071.1 DNA gyrase subunit B [Mycoplasmoides genitalium]AAC71219.1 DNA gyrase, B subunit [Mycoplasmoides genitalium G37]AFQ02814.1 DNA gyrase subunit B [Mycoplasmoides genitalium M2321]AFQ03313.1 DNA gyrase subunit B [Mycoplasmoides genitalium M6282]